MCWRAPHFCFLTQNARRYVCVCMSCRRVSAYGVATSSRLPKNIGLFCKRDYTIFFKRDIHFGLAAARCTVPKLPHAIRVGPNEGGRGFGVQNPGVCPNPGVYLGIGIKKIHIYIIYVHIIISVFVVFVIVRSQIYLRDAYRCSSL